MNVFINKKIVCFQKTYVQNTNDTSVPLEFFCYSSSMFGEHRTMTFNFEIDTSWCLDQLHKD